MPDYFIDTHCHLHDQEWFSTTQAEEILQSAASRDVRQVITIGTDPEDSENARQFAKQHENVFWTYGIHPEFASKYAQDAQDYRPGQPDKLVAIGEIGLDYHYEGYSREAQIQLFEAMLQLAQDLKLPVSLHIREAFTDAWPVLDNFSGITGVVHSFTGSKKDLRQALARGFYIGVNGVVTYTTTPLPPLEQMVLETDAPFLTPVPYRGRMNQSGYVRQVASYLAKTMGVAEVEIREHTSQNAKQLFGLPEPTSAC